MAPVLQPSTSISSSQRSPRPSRPSSNMSRRQLSRSQPSPSDQAFGHPVLSSLERTGTDIIREENSIETPVPALATELQQSPTVDPTSTISTSDKLGPTCLDIAINTITMACYSHNFYQEAWYLLMVYYSFIWVFIFAIFICITPDHVLYVITNSSSYLGLAQISASFAGLVIYSFIFISLSHSPGKIRCFLNHYCVMQTAQIIVLSGVLSLTFVALKQFY